MLINKYDKDQLFEKAIDSLNKQLNLSQSELFFNEIEDKVSIHIIGAPRSGTTLLSQLILSTLEVGFINNFIAAFWNAPLYGIHLSKKLLGNNYISNFFSDHGRTNNVQEPHEFSYFWKKHLKYSDFSQKTYDKDHQINWVEFREIINQMVNAFDNPIVFKSFLYGFHAAKAIEYMPKTIFLFIRRDVYQNAFSILKLRQKMYGSMNHWASIKPHQYSFLKDENIYRQVMGQVYFLNYEYEKQLSLIPDQNKLTIEYKDLCLNPDQILNSISDKVNFFQSIKSNQNIEFSSVNYKSSEIPGYIFDELRDAEKWLLTNYTNLI